MHRPPTRIRPALAAGGILTAAALVAGSLSATAASTPGATGPDLPALDGVTRSTDPALDVRKVTAAVVPNVGQRKAVANPAQLGRQRLARDLGRAFRHPAFSAPRQAGTSPGPRPARRSPWPAPSSPPTAARSGSTMPRSPRWL